MTDVFLTSVEGNRQRLDGGAMFGNAPKAVWERWCPTDAENRIELACRCMLVEMHGKLILCETGIGAFFEPKLAQRYGVTSSEHVLLASLAKIGKSHGDIDYVVLSHLHFDHAGGLLPAYSMNDQEILFPQAKFVVGKRAFERALHPHVRDRASFIPGLAEKLAASGRLLLVDGETHPQFFPEQMRFLFTDGHTPGHMHTIVRGTNKTAFFAGDLIPGRAWVHEPITMGYDRYAELIIDEKHAVYAKAIPEHWLLFYTHDAAVAASEIERNAKGQVVPRCEHPVLEHFAL